MVVCECVPSNSNQISVASHVAAGKFNKDKQASARNESLSGCRLNDHMSSCLSAVLLQIHHQWRPIVQASAYWI